MNPDNNSLLFRFAAYPIFALHRMYLKKSPSSTQHLYFLLTGMVMAWWAVGCEYSQRSNPFSCNISDNVLVAL